MTAEENKVIARRYSEEIWGKGNMDAIDELVAPDYVDHIPFPETAPNREGLKQSVGMFRSAFPDLSVTVEEIVAEGDKVVSRWTTKGTHKGELMGIPPTGKHASMNGITVNRIANGKIVEEWTLADMASLMQQLGVTPPPGPPSE